MPAGYLNVIGNAVELDLDICMHVIYVRHSRIGSRIKVHVGSPVSYCGVMASVLVLLLP